MINKRNLAAEAGGWSIWRGVKCKEGEWDLTGCNMGVESQVNTCTKGGNTNYLDKLWKPRLEPKTSLLWYHVKLHTLANTTKSPNWWKGIHNPHIHFNSRHLHYFGLDQEPLPAGGHTGNSMVSPLIRLCWTCRRGIRLIDNCEEKSHTDSLRW